MVLLADHHVRPVLSAGVRHLQSSAGDWVLATALAFSVVPVLEALKWMARRGWFGELV